ncbi:hypothetical protein RCOM_1493360 [Ricinus communis]|uniref:RNase H type-1 domain-containing protein n=1 Tax=Ricinus communis TaxID=3988 RepID=B9RQJ4_RICCO|nr:hypothetical protein RCOM_1493360 [Ricinus communis]
MEGVSWSVSDSTFDRFWEDKWVDGNNSLMDLSIGVMPDVLQNLSIYFILEGIWNWNIFQQYLHASICMKIIVVYPPNMSMGNDQVVWNHSASGIHLSKSAYERIRNVMLSSSNGIWEKIWKRKGPQKFWRNKTVFGTDSMNPLKVIHAILHNCHWVATALSTNVLIDADNNDLYNENIFWHPSSVGWIKLNVDGDVKDGKAGAGGLIRDFNGGALEYPLWPSVPWDLGYRRVLVESDAKEVVDMLTTSAGNQFANWVCKQAYRSSMRITNLSSPSGLRELLLSDALGTSFVML